MMDHVSEACLRNVIMVVLSFLVGPRESRVLGISVEDIQELTDELCLFAAPR